MNTINICLIEPEIPQNTGNIARTCAVTGAALHLVKPFGFEIQDIRLGGLKQRLTTAKEKIAAYVNGEIDAIEEYDAQVLDYLKPGTKGKMPQYNSYVGIASANVF